MFFWPSFFALDVIGIGCFCYRFAHPEAQRIRGINTQIEYPSRVDLTKDPIDIDGTMANQQRMSTRVVPDPGALLKGGPVNATAVLRGMDWVVD